MKKKSKKKQKIILYLNFQMAPMTISGSNPWLVVEKTMNAHEEIPVSCTWEIEIIGKDARLLIINDKVSGGRVVSKECYPCSFRVFKLRTIFFPFLKVKSKDQTGRSMWSSSYSNL